MQEASSETPPLKVLFIAYFYPPSESTGVPGSMRTVKFVRALSNVEAHVLTTQPQVGSEADALGHLPLPVKGEKIHRVAVWDIFKALLALRKFLTGRKTSPVSGSSSQTTFRSQAPNTNNKASAIQRLKDFIYDACYFPDQAGPWIIPATIRGIRETRKNGIDAIFATGSPWSGLIVGYLVSRFCGKPLVADFRDPWMNNPFHHSKGKLLDSLALRLERKVVKHARAVSLNTEPLMEEFSVRYPEQRDKFLVLPNGYDPSDFEDISANDAGSGSPNLVLCHAGFLYGVRDPAVLLEAIRLANRKRAGKVGKIVFHQIGDVQLDYSLNDRFKDLLDDGSLIINSPMPYKECLRSLASADLVVNIQPGTKTQIPSKLYDYLALGRPIINITPADGALGRLVVSKGLGELYGFDDTEGLASSLDARFSNGSTEPFSGYQNAPDFHIDNISDNLYETLIAVSSATRQN